MSRRRHLGVDTSTPPIGAQVSTRSVDASVKVAAEPSTLQLHLQGLKCPATRKPQFVKGLLPFHPDEVRARIK